MRRLVAVALCVGSLSACAGNNSMNKQEIGTGAGALIGGLAGAFVGNGSGKIAAVIAGGAIGGLIGNQIGQMLDEHDQIALQNQTRLALLTQQDQNRTNWKSDRSGATATVVPSNTRVEKRQVRVAREANVVPSPAIDLIGETYVTKTATKVYLGPSTKSAQSTSLPKDKAIWAVGKVSNKPWILIAKNGKSIGYVSASSVVKVEKSTMQKSAAFDLDADAPLRTPNDLDALGPTQNGDMVMASVTCRDIATTATAQGTTATSMQTACKSPDGAWQLN